MGLEYKDDLLLKSPCTLSHQHHLSAHAHGGDLLARDVDLDVHRFHFPKSPECSFLMRCCDEQGRVPSDNYRNAGRSDWVRMPQFNLWPRSGARHLHELL